MFKTIDDKKKALKDNDGSLELKFAKSKCNIVDAKNPEVIIWEEISERIYLRRVFFWIVFLGIIVAFLYGY